jgi:hypothetical protein
VRIWRRRSGEESTAGESGESGEVAKKGLVRNETFFRRSNELLVADAVRVGSHRSDIICECAARGCVARITMTIEEYRNVRATSDRFAILAGHENLSIEDVVERHPEYLIVCKRGTNGPVSHTGAAL